MRLILTKTRNGLDKSPPSLHCLVEKIGAGLLSIDQYM